MNNVWEELSYNNLLDNIGNDTIDKIEEVYPYLSGSEEEDVDDKFKLAKIMNAVVGADLLQKKDFRKSVFYSLAPGHQDLIKKEFQLTDNKLYMKFINQLISDQWIRNDRNERVCECLGISKSSLPDPIEKVGILTKFTIDKEKTTFKQLKEYQFPVVNDSLKHISNTPLGNFMIQMPTGSGKTRVAMEIISHFINDHTDKRINVVWLAHSSELLEQACACFEEIWSFLGKKDISIIRLWGGTKGYPSSEYNNVIFGGFDKLYSAISKDPNSLNHYQEDLKLIIVDEAHRAVAPTYKQVITSLAGIKAIIIGLSATPIRASDESSKELVEFFQNELIKIPDTDGKSIIQYLRSINVLSKVERECLDGTSIKATNADKQHYENYFDISAAILKKLSNDAQRNINILNKLKTLIDENKQVMLFACSVEHSKFICGLLTMLKIDGNQIRAAHIDGTTSKNRRNFLIEEFKNKNINVICNYELLSTGFDAPKIDAVLITRPTYSSVLYSQMIGRGLRGKAMGGTEYCQIIEVIDNIEGYPDAAELFENFKDIFEDISDNEF